MNLLSKLEALNLKLPTVTSPGGNYSSVNIRGNILYVAIQFPISNEDYFYQGTLGENLTDEDGYFAMQMCALNVIAQVEKNVGCQNILGLNHFDAYYRAVDDWDNAPLIVNGASDFFVNVLGNKGIHTRSILGVEKLPRNFAVGLTCTFTLY